MAKAATSFLAQGLSGAMGQVVFVNGPNGTYLREKPTYRAASRSRKELDGQSQTAIVAAAWAQLSPEEMIRWRAYAESLAAAQPRERRVTSSGYAAYFALSKKLLQVDQTAPLPTDPPVGRFPGDVVTFEVHA
ncbi:hypothetical protein EON82_12010, partial [bacterium]